MRFEEISVRRYGPFTDFSAVLPSSSADLHLFYAPNEGGKSSLQRAIVAFLYGIPGQTSDDFLHDYRHLEIEAKIQTSAFDQQALTRRKGRGVTLTSEDGSAFPEPQLKEALGGVSKDLFTSVFSLDSDSLVRGGQELLQPANEIAQILFSASMGNVAVLEALATLRQEAEQLFKSGGRNQVLRRLTTDIKTLQTEIRQKEQNQESVRELMATLESQKSLVTQLSEDFSRTTKELQNTEKAQRIRPLLEKWEGVKEELEGLKNYHFDDPRLIERLEKLADQLTPLAVARNLAEKQVAELREQFLEKPINQGLVADREEVEKLHRKETEIATKRAKIPKIAKELEVAGQQLEQALEPLELDRLSLALGPEVTVVDEEAYREKGTELRESASRLDILEASLKSGEGTEEENKVDHQQLQEVPKLKDSTRKAQSLSEGLEGLREEVAEKALDLENLTYELGLTQGNAPSAIPSDETLEKRQKEIEQAQRELRDLEKELEGVQKDQEEKKNGLGQMRKASGVPDLAELQKLREVRDDLVREESGEEGDLELIFSAMAKADAYSDFCFEKAQLIGSIREQEEAGALLAKKAAVLEEKIRQVKARLDASLEDFGERFSFLSTPLFDPREGRDWLKKFDHWKQVKSEHQALQRQIKNDEESVEGVATKLRAFLGQKGDFAELSDGFEKWQEDHQKSLGAEKARAKIEQTRANFRADLEKEQALERSLKVELQTATERFRGPPNLVRKAQLSLATVESLEEELGALTQSVSNFESRSEKLLTRHQAPDLNLLFERTQAEEKKRAVNKTATDLTQQASTRLAEAETALQQAKGEVSHELKVLPQHPKTDFSETLSKLRRVRELRREFGEIEQRLREEGEVPNSLSEAQKNLRKVELTDLEAQSAVLKARKLAKETELQDSERAFIHNEGELKRLQKGSADLAEAHQKYENLKTTIVAQSRRFILLSQTVTFLEEQIELHRQKVQDPLLHSTSEYFLRLCNQAFQGLDVEAPLGQKPRLVALRDGKRIGLAGLSEGTACQLYLALRLGVIDMQVEKGRAVPMILDDILMTFDDHRTALACDVLMGFARKTQVLLFTHHQSVVEAFEQKGLPKTHLHQLR